MRHGGFEPPTTWLKVKCSTNWASIPCPFCFLVFSYSYSFLSCLSLLSLLSLHTKCPVPESNQRHTDFQSVALPTELTGHNAFALSCGDRIWTCDLRVMSPASFQTAPPRAILLKKILTYYSKNNGQRWIRTTEASCSRFTVCPLWPLGNLPIFRVTIHFYSKPMIGLEPITCWLQISCSANWATSASDTSASNGTYRARTCDPLLVRQMLSQLS